MDASQQVVPVSISDECPWCGSLISHDRFLEIESKIRREEQKRVSALTLEIEESRPTDTAGQSASSKGS